MECLFRPHVLLHPDRLEDVLSDVVIHLPPAYKKEQEEGLFDVFMDRLVCKRYGINWPVRWPSDEATYLLELSFDALDVLFLRAGLCLQYPQIITIVNGAEVKKLFDAIGRENDEFLWEHGANWVTTMPIDFHSKEHTTALGRWFVLHYLSDSIVGRNRIRLRTSPDYDMIALNLPSKVTKKSHTLTVEHLTYLLQENFQ